MDLLTFVLKNSFFKCGENFYHQISESAMGSPVSAVIAELVMQEVETMALASSPVSIKWWRRYVDDSHSCMKNDDVNSFHNHLNSINQHIKFTIELPTVSEDGISISYLHTQTTVSPNGEVVVAIHRKFTDKETYLPFDSITRNSTKLQQ